MNKILVTATDLESVGFSRARDVRRAAA